MARVWYCKFCDQDKPIKDFGAWIIKRNQHKCRECHNARTRERYAENPKKFMSYAIKYRYSEKGKEWRKKFDTTPAQRKRQREQGAKARATGKPREAYEFYRDNLSLGYIARSGRLKKDDLTPELVEILRKKIILTRNLKQLRSNPQY